MLFNSQVFLFAFLPIALAGFYISARLSPQLARVWLVSASLFFYAWWNPPYLLLLLGSALVNFVIGRLLQGGAESLRSPLLRKAALAGGLSFNLLLLGYFKYFAFLLGVAAGISGRSIAVPDIVLPLAISFYTFQKIGYLAESYSGQISDRSFLNYLLFVSFFPQLISGPIVRYDEVVPQFCDRRTFRFHAANFAEGLTIFLLGLAKKVVLADQFAIYADVEFLGAAAGHDVSLVVAWVSVIAYTLQIYFDFSGYSDMAIGLGRMFNISLPLNFNSPYQAECIIEFWRRWHMTLSRFLRDYVYIPLGGNRRGPLRRYINVLLTMIIGGLWHGAGWTFLLWGALHGLYLVINHAWRALTRSTSRGRAARIIAHSVTILSVVVAWVLFRAPDFDAAELVYLGMLGRNGAVLPEEILQFLPPLRHIFASTGYLSDVADRSIMGTMVTFVMLLLGTLLVLRVQNVHKMSPRLRLLAVVASFAFVIQKVVFSQSISPFVYFQF